MNITLEQIRNRADSKSYNRGQGYYEEGAIHHPIKRGNTLEADCEGTMTYHVKVEFDGKGIQKAKCTCPYEFGGDCKHIVALLLMYVHEPKSFVEQDEVQKSLQNRSKEELIKIIEQMIAMYPDLVHFLDRPAKAKPISLDTFRRNLSRALKKYSSWENREAETVAASLMKTAKQISIQGDWQTASAIYSLILEEILHTDGFYDEEGGFYTSIESIFDDLDTCLAQPAIANDDILRPKLLMTLLEFSFADETDFASDVEEILLKHAKPSDLPAIRQAVQARMNKYKKMSYGDWIAKSLAEFLVKIDAVDHVDPEVTLQRLREEGMFSVLFEKLLSMGRHDEAIAVLEKKLLHNHERLPALNSLVASGFQKKAIAIGQTTLNHTYHDHLAYWLLEQYQATHNPTAALEIQLKRLYEQPIVELYIEVKLTAIELGQWDKIQPDILKHLTAKGYFAALTYLYLHEHDWDKAWQSAEKGMKQKMPLLWWHDQRLDLQVAKLAYRDTPEKALPVLIDYAYKEIAGRSRSHYQTATDYLAKVQEIYDILGEVEKWEDLITGIRQEFKTLRALQDELQKAGL